MVASWSGRGGRPEPQQPLFPFRCLPRRTSLLRRARPHQSSLPRLTPNGVSSRCSSVTWWIRPCSASQLDPEDLREVVRAYQETCAKVIARYEGHIAQYLGDGLLVYFGYPLAHEDDAQRAVRAGLGMVEAVGQLNTRLAQEQGVQLAVRLGIHTGLVVVGRSEVAPGRNSWLWARRPTSRPACKGWQRPIPW